MRQVNRRTSLPKPTWQPGYLLMTIILCHGLIQRGATSEQHRGQNMVYVGIAVRSAGELWRICSIRIPLITWILLT
ncbi:hypothetical protein GQ53DRAFT_366471 [Thozetella sp. PMI_491]|nr:hypothetical protein GQ53DRAFT_366471 [Thozetella sp. PMI_491]